MNERWVKWLRALFKPKKWSKSVIWGEEMFFWWYMLVTVMSCPLIMIFAGWLMWKVCAKGKPSAVGYRTRRSTASVKAGRFANEDCGRRWLRWGCIALLPSMMAMLSIYGANDDIVGTMGGIIVMIDCALMIALILPTERALKREFGE